MSSEIQNEFESSVSNEDSIKEEQMEYYVTILDINHDPVTLDNRNTEMDSLQFQVGDPKPSFDLTDVEVSIKSNNEKPQDIFIIQSVDYSNEFQPDGIPEINESYGKQIPVHGVEFKLQDEVKNRLNEELSEFLKIENITGDTGLQCEFCFKRFLRKDILTQHLRIHTGETPFQCQFCSKQFNQKIHLNRHKMTHTRSKPFQCEFCLKQFCRKDILERHKRIHTEENPFQCRFCCKQFGQKEHLQTHMRTHTAYIPFECEFCFKKFVRKENLRRHIVTHTGDAEFKCEFCSKPFFRKDHLDQHIRTHTGETPFHCEFCSKKFTQKVNLRRHIKTHVCQNKISSI